MRYNLTMISTISEYSRSYSHTWITYRANVGRNSLFLLSSPKQWSCCFRVNKLGNQRGETICSPGKYMARKGVSNPVPWMQPYIARCDGSGSKFITAGPVSSPTRHTRLLWCTKPLLCNVINSCQVQRVPPVLKFARLLVFLVLKLWATWRPQLCVTHALSPTTSPGPHRVDAPSKICQWINVLFP